MKKKVALLLGSGIARGLANIGVLKVLDREKIRVDLIIGNSIGGFVGALYAGGVDVKDIEHFGTTTSLRHFFNGLDILNPFYGFFSGGKLVRRFNSLLGEKDFSDLKTKMIIPVFDLRKGKEVLLSRGSVNLAVRATIAYPLFFKPVKHKNMLLVDGGLLNPFPLDVARKNADIVIAVNIGRKYKKLQSENYVNIVRQAVYYTRNELKKLKCENYVPDVTISPKVQHYEGYALSKAKEIIREGELAAIRKLPEIRKILAKK